MSAETRAAAAAHPHSMVRLDVATGIPFDDFLAAFEAAVPVIDAVGVRSILASGGTWDDVAAAVDRTAPHGMLIYGKLDVTPLMTAAGHHVKSVQYLVGNHVIAERMFRHDPVIALYAPLRVLLSSDADDHAVLSIDQPSTVFAALGNASITEVGLELDQKIASILAVLGVAVPPELSP